MKKYIYEILVLFLSLVSLVFIFPYLSEKNKDLKSFDYCEKISNKDDVFLYKILGLKKFGASVFWIKQIQSIAKLNKKSIEEIKSNSEKISYLNPYFLGNYYLSASTLALINSRSKYDYAIEILNRGIRYNQNEEKLFFYISGIIASSKISVKYLENQIIKSNDPLLIYILAYKYEDDYKTSKNEESLKNAFNLWKILINSNNLEYKRKAKTKIEEYN